MIATGLLDQKIEIYRNDSQPDNYGGSTPGQALYWSTNAKVKQLRTRRTTEANQSPLLQVFSFEIRYRTDRDIRNDDMIKWRNNFFTIVGYVPDVVNREYVKFDAVERNMASLVAGSSVIGEGIGNMIIGTSFIIA